MDIKKVLVINGPNLNLTGIRETGVYGKDTLETIKNYIFEQGKNMGMQVDFFQSNIEGEIINAIHSVLKNYDGAIINAGAYTHYSYAIRDAVKSVDKPFIEVHLSNPNAREEFRNTSVLTPVCCGVISGFGKNSYVLALNALGLM